MFYPEFAGLLPRNAGIQIMAFLMMKITSHKNLLTWVGKRRTSIYFYSKSAALWLWRFYCGMCYPGYAISMRQWRKDYWNGGVKVSPSVGLFYRGNGSDALLLVAQYTVYPKKYAHRFVVLCFVVVMQSFIMNSHEVFIHIHQGCFAGTGLIVRLPQCQWSKPVGYGKISQCITTTKHSKAKTVCILVGIYCTAIMSS